MNKLSFVQVLLAVLLIAYVPKLDSYPGYVPLSDSVDDVKNEKPLGEQVCPERRANIFSGECGDTSFIVKTLILLAS